jgi:hypothetical protein
VQGIGPNNGQGQGENRFNVFHEKITKDLNKNLKILF